MASIVKRGPKQFHVRIRQKGFPPRCQTFTSRDEARVWASIVENEMLRGIYVSRHEAEKTTLQSALDRYAKEVTPQKKGAANEKRRINSWKSQPLAARRHRTIGALPDRLTTRLPLECPLKRSSRRSPIGRGLRLVLLRSGKQLFAILP
jgi:hypothetical protein